MIFFLSGQDEAGVSNLGGIVTPTPGTTLPGSSVTFIWLPVAEATGYKLNLGTTFGGTEICAGAPLDPGMLTVTISPIPTDGAVVYAQLLAEVDSAWIAWHCIYTAYLDKATLITPAHGSTLSANYAVLSIDPGSATAVRVTIGASEAQQSGFYYDSGEQTVLGNPVGLPTGAVLPTTGATLYVKVWGKISSVWSYNSYTLTAFTARKAYITSPLGGSNLIAGSWGFNWAVPSGSSPLHFRFELGTNTGLHDLAYSSSLAPTVLTRDATIPSSVGTIFLRLSTEVSTGVWEYNDYSYTTNVVTIPVPTSFAFAMMTNPLPGPNWIAASTTFSWVQPPTTGTPNYYLQVGTGSPGASNVYNSTALSGTSQAVTGIPSGTVYVRLTTFNTEGSESSYYDYVYGSVGAPTLNVQATGSTARYEDPYDAAYLPWVQSPPGGYYMIDGSGDVASEAVQWIIQFDKPYNFKAPVAPYTFTRLAVLWTAPIDPTDGAFIGPWTEITTAGVGTWNFPTHNGIPTPSVPANPTVDDFWFIFNEARTELTINKYFGYNSEVPALYCLELRGNALIDDHNQPHPGIAPQAWQFYIFDPDPPV